MVRKVIRWRTEPDSKRTFERTIDLKRRTNLGKIQLPNGPNYVENKRDHLWTCIFKHPIEMIFNNLFILFHSASYPVLAIFKFLTLRFSIGILHQFSDIFSFWFLNSITPLIFSIDVKLLKIPNNISFLLACSHYFKEKIWSKDRIWDFVSDLIT